MKTSLTVLGALLLLMLIGGIYPARATAAPLTCPLPVAPDVTASRSGDDLVLGWTHDMANSGGYDIFRSAAPYFTPGSVYAHVGPAAGAGDPLQFTDGAVLGSANPTDYFYIVRATTVCDGSTADSAPVGFFRFGLERPLGLGKAEAQALYDTRYEPFDTTGMNWTGDHATCDAGTTSAAFRTKVLDLINYFRAMAGVPDNIVFSDTYNAKAQQAALMQSVNGSLNHDPPSDWECYTADGDEASQHSNLSTWVNLGTEYHGVIGQMRDGGSNYYVGHRRWLLCPQTQTMGTGDVPQVNPYWAINALWVIDDNSIWLPRPETRDGFVAWPPPGYVPGDVVYPRWSFSYADADFGGATVSMSHDGNTVAAPLEPLLAGACENTLVWVPDVDWGALDLTGDQRFQVTVANVVLDGVTQTFDYEVTIFAP